LKEIFHGRKTGIGYRFKVYKGNKGIIKQAVENNKGK